jgi:hypothetical protein
MVLIHHIVSTAGVGYRDNMHLVCLFGSSTTVLVVPLDGVGASNRLLSSEFCGSVTIAMHV